MYRNRWIQILLCLVGLGHERPHGHHPRVGGGEPADHHLRGGVDALREEIAVIVRAMVDGLTWKPA